MLRIDYTSEGFGAGGPVSNGQTSLSVTWDDLLWAALTVGRPNRQYVFKHGLSSRYEALFRLSLVRMALEQAGPKGVRFRRTAAAKTLDPSEKGAVNYFIGMAIGKMFADLCLDAPWMLHLDFFRPQLNAVLTGRSRPDLVGETNAGAWVALECKGRLSAPSAIAKDKAKEQAERVIRVNGVVPAYNVGCITFLRNDVLQFFWRDPTPDESKIKNPIEVQVLPQHWARYYDPVLSLIAEDRAGFEEQDGAMVARLEEADIKVLVQPRVFAALREERWEQARHVMGRLEGADRERFHADGIAVVAGPSWSERFKDEGAEPSWAGL